MDFSPETRRKLKNGASLLSFCAPHLHSVAFSVVLPFVPEGTAGVHHLVEHMFFERAGKMRAPEINAAMNANGSEIDGYTSSGYMCFRFCCRKEVFESQLGLLFSMLSQRDYGREEFEKVLPVIRNEIFEYHFYDDRAGDVLRELWFDSRYISPILGEIGYLERLEEDEIDGVREKLFTDGMCLFLAGAFSEKDVRAVEASFGSMRLEPFSPDPPREEEKVTTPYSRWGRGREWQALVTYHVEKADTELKMAAHWLRSGLFDGLDAAFFRYFGDNGFQFYSVDGSYNVRGDELVFSYLCYIKKRERALFEGLIDGFEKYAEKTDFLRLVRPYLYDNIVLLCDNPERLCSHYVDAWADHSAPVTLREEYEFCGRFDNARLVRNWRKIASSLRRVFYLGK